MPACVNCGEHEFELADGLYFCTTCQTQTQDIQQIEQDEELNFTSVRNVVHRKEPQKKVLEQRVVGRPWSIYEGFQLIIKKQVDALITLGADKKLQDIVFRLWISYLNASGVAFCKESELKNPSKLDRQRELFPGTLERPEVNPKKYRKTYYKHFSKSFKDVESQQINTDLLSQFTQEKFYDEDRPESNESDSGMSDKSSTDEDDVYHPSVDKVPLSAAKRKRKKEQMSMLKTISLCYVGLMFTNNLTMPSDIIRWIKQHKIPYLNATSYFPDHMKLYSTDYDTFRSTVPKLKSFQEQVGKWCHVLELDTFPPVCMTSLLAKYITMLHLPGPYMAFALLAEHNCCELQNQQHLFILTVVDFKPLGELLGIANSLVQHVGPKFQYFQDLKIQVQLPNFEAAAMSFIILTMKIIFGLDDHLERLLSEYGRSLKEIKPSESNIFFIFEEWATSLSKDFSCGKYHLTVEESELDEIRDINNSLLSLYHDSIQSSKFSETRDKKRNINKIQTRINLQKPFIELGSNTFTDHDKRFLSEVTLDRASDITRNSLINQEEASFNLNDSFMTLQSDQSMGDGVASQSTHRPLNLFSKQSVKYITHPNTVLDDFDNSVLSDYTLYSSMVDDSQDSDSDNDSANDEFDLPALSLQTHSARPKLKKKKCSLSKQAVRKRLKSRTQKTKLDEKKLEETVTKFIDSQESYAIYSQCQSTTDRSRSFQWLLSIMSCIIYCSVDDLEEELNRWESMYFPYASKWSKNIGKRFTRFKKNYNLCRK